MSNFPRLYRITTPNEFKIVFNKAKRLNAKGVCAYIYSNNLGFPRLGLSIPKKYVKKAVERNSIKRLFRESFRAEREGLPAVDIVVVVRCGRDKIGEQAKTIFSSIS